MPASPGAPPATGWARLAPELHVTDSDASLRFWTGPIGFRIAFQRPEERSAHLERPEGAQIMLCQRHGRWETGPMEPPYGRGIMLQVYVDDLVPVLAALEAARWPIHIGPREIWRRTGDVESGQREVFVQDPDGYRLMVAANIGRRPLTPVPPIA